MKRLELRLGPGSSDAKEVGDRNQSASQAAATASKELDEPWTTSEAEVEAVRLDEGAAVAFECRSVWGECGGAWGPLGAARNNSQSMR